MFRAARNRALLTVFVTLGGRKEATMDLDRRDYLRGFRCPDGELSPAIALRPGKHAPPDQVSWKPIPEGEALVLDVYLAVAERELGAPMPASGPLFIPSLTKFDKHMTGGSASYSGDIACLHGGGASPRLTRQRVTLSEQLRALALQLLQARHRGAEGRSRVALPRQPDPIPGVAHDRGRAGHHQQDPSGLSGTGSCGADRP